MHQIVLGHGGLAVFFIMFITFGVLQDELAVTRKSYEEQLSLMSDHLAAMNDKLSSQKDEIENLKLNSKVGCFVNMDARRSLNSRR